MPKEKLSRCPKGTIRNKKTGLCEAKGEAKSSSPKTLKLVTILEERRACIQKYRKKIGTQKKRK